MAIRSASLLAVLALLVACSKEGNPVALPSDPGGPSSALQLSVQTDSSALIAGSTKPARLTIVATQGNGAPAPDGISITLNTTLGAFAFDAAGKPVQLAKLTLAAGRATTQFFAGATAGTATIMATAGTVVATLNLPITTAPPEPVANFEFVTDRLTAIFTDISTGAPDTYRWDFGDGETSSVRNPSHTYAAASKYQVTLTVSNTAGSSSKSQFVTASLGDPPMAAFEFTIDGQKVNFVDMSAGATSWSWNFGDGKTSNLRNPIHVYPAPGTFTVTLAASNAAGTTPVSKALTIAAPPPPPAPVAAFTFTVTQKQVNFIDASTGSPASWQWTFGDGNTSSVPNPIHAYVNPGAYTVTLTVSNGSGSDSISQVVTIAPGTPPVSAFTYQPHNLQVNFADASTGNPTSWNWSFGDGTTSTQQNPVHIYPAFGTYTVVLTVSNASGSDPSSQIVRLAAPPAPVASFTATVNAAAKQVNFVDASTGSPTSWLWNFGDATSSTQQNPIHVYPAAGSYTVTLTAANASGSSKATQVVTIPPSEPPSP